MTLSKFVRTWQGRKIDYDNQYGAQCVDLFRAYCRDVLDIEQPDPVDGARDFYIKYESMPTLQRYFNRSAECATLNIEAGDVLVWDKTKSNKYGHIAVCVGNIGTNALIVFEQDGFLQNGARLFVRDRSNLLGILWRK